MVRYKVTLTAEERQQLEKLVSSGKGAARKLTHARILLLADEGDQGPGRTNAAIVEALGVGERTVERVRKRFVMESLDAALHPRPQPPRPDKVKIKGPVEKQLIELACSDPPAGRCRWTLQLLAERLVVLQCVEGVSHEAVRQALKKTTSRRGR
jgi:transposase